MPYSDYYRALKGRSQSPPPAADRRSPVGYGLRRDDGLAPHPTSSAAVGPAGDFYEQKIREIRRRRMERRYAAAAAVGGSGPGEGGARGHISSDAPASYAGTGVTPISAYPLGGGARGLYNASADGGLPPSRPRVGIGARALQSSSFAPSRPAHYPVGGGGGGFGGGFGGGLGGGGGGGLGGGGGDARKPVSYVSAYRAMLSRMSPPVM